MKSILPIVSTLMLLAGGPALAGGDAARGEALSEDCAMCHGEDGKGDDETPGIAGVGEAEHVAMLKAYATGEREDPSGMMADYAAALSEQEMADLAAYYATLE